MKTINTILITPVLLVSLMRITIHYFAQKLVLLFESIIVYNIVPALEWLVRHLDVEPWSDKRRNRLKQSYYDKIIAYLLKKQHEKWATAQKEHHKRVLRSISHLEEK